VYPTKLVLILTFLECSTKEATHNPIDHYR
jgi:hypothetical protein